MLASMLLATLLAAPAVAKPAVAKPAAAASPDASQKAAEAAAQAADSAAKAAESASKAADAAAKAADRAAAAADHAASAVEKIAAAERAPAAAVSASSTAPAAAAPPPAAATSTEQAWTGSLNLGTIFLTGNSETITFTTALALERKSEDWIWGLKAAGAYGQTRAATTGLDQVTALNGMFMLRGDRRFGPVASAFLKAIVSSDHVASIEVRPVGEVGASIIWFDEKEGTLAKSSLKTDLGFSYGREVRFQYYPTPAHVDSVDLIGPHVGVAYRYAISKDIIFNDDLDLTPNLVGDARLIVANNAKLAARLSATLSLGVGFNFVIDTAPAAGKKSVDTATMINLEFAL
jgi:hypothetical protein